MKHMGRHGGSDSGKSRRIAARNMAESGVTTGEDSKSEEKKEEKTEEKVVSSSGQDLDLRSKIIKAVNKKQQSKSAIYALSAEIYSTIKGFFSTGIPWLDKIMGGGAPKGRIIEIFGWEGSGKTAILEDIIVACMREGGLGIVFEPETALEKHRLRQKLLERTDLYKHLAPTLVEWIEKKKADPNYPDPLDDILYSPADTAEQIFDEIETIVDVIAKEDPDRGIIVGWDSVAATTTESEIKNAVGDQQYSKQSIIISRAMRKLRRKIADTGVSLVFLNQLRSKVNAEKAHGSEDYETFGGKAIRFYSTIRINLKKVGKIKLKKAGDDDDEMSAKERKKKAREKVDGVLIEAETVKNKIFGVPPYQRARFPIMFFEGGISPERSALLFLKEKNMIDRGGDGQTVIGIDGDSFTEVTWPEYYKRHAEDIEDAFFTVPKDGVKEVGTEDDEGDDEDEGEE